MLTSDPFRMGTKRKKAQKNAAFKKTKLKVCGHFFLHLKNLKCTIFGVLQVGKILKKTNTTDSTIESRKVVLLTQLEEQSGSSTAVYSYRFGICLFFLDVDQFIMPSCENMSVSKNHKCLLRKYSSTDHFD